MKRGYPAILRGVTLDEVIEHVAFEFGVNGEEIVGVRNHQYFRLTRFAVAWLADRHTRADAIDVAAALRRCEKTAAMLLRWGKKLHRDDVDFRLSVNRLDAMLSTLGEERGAHLQRSAPICAVTTVPSDVARLIRAVDNLRAAVPMPFIAERIEVEAALRAFEGRVATVTTTSVAA